MPVEPVKRRKSYQKNKKQGYCPRCGIKKKKTDTFVYCKDCRGYFRDYNEGISAKVNKARKSKYKLRIKNNQCPRCGIKLGKRYPKKLCVTCLDKQYKYNYGKKRKTVKKK